MQNRFLYGISGFLVLKLKGDNTERFLNMCRAHEIELWDIKCCGDFCICRMFAYDFAKIRPIARKTNIRVSVTKKRGIPFYLPVVKRYSWLLVMAFAIIILLIYSTNFVWAVEYVGNLQVSDDELTDFLREENINYGIKKKDIDCDTEEKRLRDRFQNVIWTSVYFEGTKLFINIKENEKLEPTAISSSGSDMVSGDGGVVVSMLIRNGNALVKVGDTVEKGQVLVSGSVPVYNEEQEVIGYQMYDADADIYIQTTLEYNLKINKTYSKTYYTGNNINSKFIQIYNYRIDGIKILDFFLAKRNMKYETVTYRRQLVLPGNVYLPIYYGKITQREYYMQYLTYTQEDMEEGLVQEIEKIIEGLEENNIKIVEKNLKMVQNRNDMELYASLVVIKPADITKSIYEDIKE